jgi:hypothetical protein
MRVVLRATLKFAFVRGPGESLAAVKAYAVVVDTCARKPHWLDHAWGSLEAASVQTSVSSSTHQHLRCEEQCFHPGR